MRACFLFLSLTTRMCRLLFLFLDGFPSHLEIFRILDRQRTKLSCYILYINVKLTQFVWILKHTNGTERANDQVSKQMETIKCRVWVIYKNKWARMTSAELLYKHRTHRQITRSTRIHMPRMGERSARSRASKCIFDTHSHSTFPCLCCFCLCFCCWFTLLFSLFFPDLLICV